MFLSRTRCAYKWNFQPCFISVTYILYCECSTGGIVFLFCAMLLQNTFLLLLNRKCWNCYVVENLILIFCFPIIIIKCLASWHGRSCFSASCSLQHHVSAHVLTPFCAMPKGCQKSSFIVFLFNFFHKSSCHMFSFSPSGNVTTNWLFLSVFLTSCRSVLASFKPFGWLIFGCPWNFSILL